MGKVEVEPIEALAAEPSAHLNRVLKIGVFIFPAVTSVQAELETRASGGHGDNF